MRSSGFELGPGAIIQIGDQQWCVRQWVTLTSVIAQCVDTAEKKEVSIDEITACLGNQTGQQLDLHAIDDHMWNEAVYRYSKISCCVNKPDKTRLDVKKVADELIVSIATVYRWIEKVERYGTITCLFRQSRSDKGITKIPANVEKIIDHVLKNEYLTKLKKSVKSTHREIKRLCRNEGVDPPSKATVCNRILQISPEERQKKRYGRNAALKLSAQSPANLGADFVHAMWQIDHTEVDIELVDPEHRIAIGKPWITVAIDVYSRMVMGWYVSFDPPGALATGICISTAILPKTTWLVESGLSYNWPCYGKPRVIHADNAKEFRGNMLKRACSEHSVDLKFRPVKKPNYGAHIERLLGTLLSEIHNLEGTTFSNPKQRGEYDSAGRATMTLEDFEKWLANLILGIYHNRKHDELGCPPLTKYKHGILGDGESPGIGYVSLEADPEKLRIDFLPFVERTIQPDGVEVDHIKYYEPVLDRWIGALDEKSKKLKRTFIFKRDPRNIGHLVFWDPDAKHYFKIPYRNITHPRMSLWELRKVRSYLEKRGKAEVDEATIFSAFDEMRRIEDEAKTKTRAQRRENARRKKHEEQVPSDERIQKPAETTFANTTGMISPPRKKIDFTKVKAFDEVEVFSGGK